MNLVHLSLSLILCGAKLFLCNRQIRCQNLGSRKIAQSPLGSQGFLSAINQPDDVATGPDLQGLALPVTCESIPTMCEQQDTKLSLELFSRSWIINVTTVILEMPDTLRR